MNRLAPARPKPGSKWRTCLGCDKTFWSTGDRLCKRCNTRNSSQRLCRNRAGGGCPVGFRNDVHAATCDDEQFD